MKNHNTVESFTQNPIHWEKLAMEVFITFPADPNSQKLSHSFYKNGCYQNYPILKKS